MTVKALTFLLKYKLFVLANQDVFNGGGSRVRQNKLLQHKTEIALVHFPSKIFFGNPHPIALLLRCFEFKIKSCNLFCLTLDPPLVFDYQSLLIHVVNNAVQCRPFTVHDIEFGPGRLYLRRCNASGSADRRVMRSLVRA